MHKEWYRENSKKILDFFKVSLDTGLTESQVLKNRQKFGENVLSEEKRRTTFDIFASQLKSPFIYVLAVATVIVLALGDVVEAIIIFSIIIINSIIGAVQEGKAEDTLAALKKVVKSYVTVIRDGVEIKIEDNELVPGDIISLRDGAAIGADARIIETNSLKVNESSLTGESTLVLKTAEPINAVNLSTADQTNMVFRGTYIVSGLAKAVVVKTGIETVIGKISKKLSGLDMDVPLKKNIANLSKAIVFVALFVSVLLFVLGTTSGYGLSAMFTMAVAVAVASIPEGLLVVVTLVLATGVWRMSKQNVLVKKLQAVEALGQAKIIALDKTGTITKNQMAVEKIFTNDKIFDVTGVGYKPEGELLENGQKIDPTTDKNLSLFLQISALTAIADITEDRENQEWNLNYGDPTEAALLILARKFGIEKSELLEKYPLILEIPFDMENKHHTSVNKISGKNVLLITGGPEMILRHCQKIYRNGRAVKISEKDRVAMDGALLTLSKDGYRILALATNLTPPDSIDPKKLPELTFVGFAGITDAIRPEVEGSVKAVQAAGMRVLMITGDHVETAKSIGRKVGIYRPGDKVLSGSEMIKMSDARLAAVLSDVTIFARVTPNDKLRIIEAYKKRGETIAMTGDGVNDALSLVAADLGVAMGKIGTEVAREASDIVLLTDDFGQIVAAAEEGRNIYWTIKKSILYLLSTNTGEVLTIILAVFLGWPLPLLASQIIWLNLVTDSFLVAPLAFDPKDKNLMKEKFEKPSKYIVDFSMLLRIIFVSILMSVVTLWMFSQYMNIDMIKAGTIALTVLTIFQWYNIFNVRSTKDSIFSKPIFNNKYLIFGLSIAACLHLFALYNPFMQKILNTTALSLTEWGMILIVGMSIVVFEEIRKLIWRIYSAQKLSLNN